MNSRHGAGLRFASVATVAAALTFSGCNTPEAPSPPKSATTLGSTSSLLGLQPRDALEVDLLAHPDDFRSLGDHAKLLYNQANAEPGAAAATELRRRARIFALAAVQAGSKDLLLPVMLAEIREDGTPMPRVFSSVAAADTLMAAGEKKFARGDLPGALSDYSEAWRLDPHCYMAALYIGDVHFADKKFAEAVPWFDRAIALDANREIAHRYRANSLMRLHRFDEARDSYINAVIADPYKNLSRATIPRWAAETHHPCSRPDVLFPAGRLTANHGKFSLSLAPDSGPLPLAYLLARAAHAEKHGMKPETYVHSLAEETDALRTMLQVARELKANGGADAELKKVSTSLAAIEHLDEAGLLEAHILLDRPDDGIARDYAAFRAAHRDLLDRYIREIWLASK